MMKKPDIKNYFKKAYLEYLIIAIALLLDLLSKGLIESNMYEGQTVSLIPNFLEFCFAYNDKAAFSFDFGLGKLLGQNGVVTAFIIMTVIAVFVFIYLLYRLRDNHKLVRIALAFVIGGALGNLYDRIFIGRVRDFIQIVYFGYDIKFLGGTSFAIFNIADSFLCVGVALLIIYILFYDKIEKKSAGKTENKENQDLESSENVTENDVDGLSNNENGNEETADSKETDGLTGEKTDNNND